METKELIAMPGAPDIPGLTFRKFRGEADYQVICDLILATKDEDNMEASVTVEDVARSYKHITNCDPYQDMLFVEVDGEAVAYGRVYWNQLMDEARAYSPFVYMLPEWRRKGLGTAIIRYQEQRLREIAAGHPQVGERIFQCGSEDTRAGLIALLKQEGYEPKFYAISMARDLSEPFPEAPMPPGLEVRPVEEEQFRAVFDAFAESFAENPGFPALTDEDFKQWQDDPLMKLEYFKVAWDGDQIAGMVLNFINEPENEEYERQRGYTERICTRRPWRKRGLARSLIVQSMEMFKEMGMTETALGVDTDNPSGALNLYQSVGYRQVQQYTTYRKPL